MENDEKQFFMIFGAWGLLFLVLFLSMVDSMPDTATYVEAIPDVLYLGSLALVYSSAAITIALIFGLHASQRFAGWIQKTSDPNCGRSVKAESKPQIEMDVFILAKSMMEYGNNTAVFLLFSKLPAHTQTPFIDDQGRFYFNGKRTDDETMMSLLRDAARKITPEAFESVSNYVKERGKVIRKNDDL